MLYYISNTILEKAKNRQEDVLRMLDDLYRAWLNGRCLIDGKRKVLIELAAIPSCAGYENVMRAKQGIANIYNYIDFYIVLLYDSNKIQDTSPTSILTATAHYLDYHIVSDERLFSSNNLLCEHVEDAKLYKWGSQFYLSSECRNVRINVTPQLGGGNTIKDDARNYHNQKQFTLCILDSDRHFPKSDVGQTAKEFIDMYNQIQSPFLWYYILEAHEIENIIPFCVLFMSNAITGKLYQCLQKLDFKDETISNFFKFLDCKKGFKPSDLRRINKDYPRVLNDIISLLVTLGAKRSRIDSELRKSYNPHCDSSFINVHNNGSLDNSSRFVEENECGEDMFILHPFQKHDWQNISRKVWAIGCASMPKRV